MVVIPLFNRAPYVTRAIHSAGLALGVLLADEPKCQHIAESAYRKASSIRTYGHLVAQLCADWAKATRQDH